MSQHKAFDELTDEQVDQLRRMLIINEDFGLPIYKSMLQHIIEDGELPTRLEGSS